MKRTKRGERESEDIIVDFIDICNNPERFINESRRNGACEDDYEVTAPYVDMCPDDKYDEEPSPMKLGGHVNLHLKETIMIGIFDDACFSSRPFSKRMKKK